MGYWLVKVILTPILRLVFRPWAEGTGNVPRDGAAIIASNHLSFADHFFGPLPIPRKVTFLAKAEYFTGSGLKGMISKAFFSGVGQIPIDRGGGEASERALRTGLRVLAKGKLLGIYPEGTRSPDGRLYRGKTGVARLALEARVLVIPCAMVGTFEMMPPGRVWPSLRIRPGVRFGKPLDFSRYYGMASDRQVLRTVTDEIMRALAELSGQEYTGVDAHQAKSQPTPATADGGGDAAARPAGGEERSRGDDTGREDPGSDGTGPADGGGAAAAAVDDGGRPAQWPARATRQRAESGEAGPAHG